MMSLPKQGTVTAAIESDDGTAMSFIAPAVLHGGRIIIDADHLATLRHVMQAAGVDDIELEFCE